MGILWRIVLIAVLPLSCEFQVVAGQQPVAPSTQETGTIQGHVYGADTNAPIRAAALILKIAQPGKALNAGDVTDFSAVVAVGSSHLDGSFSFIRLKPGRYYLMASALGYLTPVPEEETKAVTPDVSLTKKNDPATSRNPLLIDLGPAQTVQADFQLERGASIEGRILYDDGSPMTSTVVKALRKALDGSWKEFFNGIGLTTTDDLGRYRIAGLQPGEYVVGADAMITTDSVFKADQMEPERSSMTHFHVYSGNVFDEKDATSFKLTRGEERYGEDLIFRASALHNVAGIVVAQQDGHPLPDAHVELDAATDGRAVDSVNVLNSSGVFRLEFVPEGRYTLKGTGGK